MIKGIRHTLENCGLTGGLGGARVGVQKTRSSHKAAMTRGTVPGSCLDIHRLHMGGLEWALSSMYTLP